MRFGTACGRVAYIADVTDDPRADSDVLDALDQFAEAVTVFLGGGDSPADDDAGLVITACGEFFLQARLAGWPAERALARANAVTVDRAEYLPRTFTDPRYRWLRSRIASWAVAGYF